MKIQTLAIAARGEIAKRIILTCRRMGIKSALLYASGDTQNEPFRIADEVFCVGGGGLESSYLSMEANIQGAKAAGADALHPGYGFLSESAAFAEECEKNGLIFIGPGKEALKAFGNKAAAKRLCAAAGVPVLPGAAFQTKEEAARAAARLSFPLMLKRAEGGGGSEIQAVRSEKELLSALSASSHFQAGEEFFLEKALLSAKHIEAQAFSDAGGEIFLLGERDCSIQRRRQKILEQAPADISQGLSQRLKGAVRAILKLVPYRGAGTFEFLVSGEDFFFLEANPRLQVEHTLTETLYGIDMVRAQLLTAMGRPAFDSKSLFRPRGFCLQARVCAEDERLIPQKGRISSLKPPSGLGIRVDTGFLSGDEMGALYDSLILKVIAWDSSRVRAIEALKQALQETVVFGLPTNIPILMRILSSESFLQNQTHVDFLNQPENFPASLKPPPFEEKLLRLLWEAEEAEEEKKKSLAKRAFDPWKAPQRKASKA